MFGKVNIKNIQDAELEEFLGHFGEKKFRKTQILESILRHRITDFSKMNLLPESLRIKLSDNFEINSIRDFKTRNSEDGSIKFLFSLDDGKSIESVFMPWENENTDSIDRKTLCISTMAGCPVNCSFCATASMGLGRLLTPAEILEQILFVEKYLDDKISNVVFMGMGEPLMNFDSVVKAVKILVNDKYKIISRKKITLSTVGVAPEIIRFADLNIPLKLAVSLHATTNDKRGAIIPLAKKFRINELFDAIEYYYRKTGIPVTYQYILFDEFNDTAADAKRLAKLARRVPSKVNIIPFNDISFVRKENKKIILRPSPEDKSVEFMSILKENDIFVMKRKTYGSDIEAACGQLALSQERNKI